MPSWTQWLCVLLDVLLQVVDLALRCVEATSITGQELFLPYHHLLVEFALSKLDTRDGDRTLNRFAVHTVDWDQFFFR